MWMHVDFWFKRRNGQHRSTRYLNDREYKQFLKYLEKLLDGIKGERFFLFEIVPHCFLAVKANMFDRIRLLGNVCHTKQPKFIRTVDFLKDSKDDINGWGDFTKVLSARTKMLFSRQPTVRWLRHFPKRWQTVAHVVHCMLNQTTGSRADELKFYQKMYYTYKGSRYGFRKGTKQNKPRTGVHHLRRSRGRKDHHGVNPTRKRDSYYKYRGGSWTSVGDKACNIQSR